MCTSYFGYIQRNMCRSRPWAQKITLITLNDIITFLTKSYKTTKKDQYQYTQYFATAAFQLSKMWTAHNTVNKLSTNTTTAQREQSQVTRQVTCL